MLRRLFSSLPQPSIPKLWQRPATQSQTMPPLPSAFTLAPQVLLQCLPNNINIIVSRSPGQTLFKLSSGLVDMKNAAKTSPKAAMALIDTLAERLKEAGIEAVRLNFRGVNQARPLLLGQIRKVGLRVTEVIDTTGIPFNGCRPKKARRV